MDVPIQIFVSMFLQNVIFSALKSHRFGDSSRLTLSGRNGLNSVVSGMKYTIIIKDMDRVRDGREIIDLEKKYGG